MNPAEIAALPAEDRTQLFMDLAERRYGPKKTLDLCAEEMGYGRRTVFDWVKLHTTPLPVIYSLLAWERMGQIAYDLIRLSSERP